MRANKVDINKAINALTMYLVKYIQDKKHCNQEEALRFLMTTTTYSALINEKTKLFCESREYLANMLEDELTGNIDAWLKI